MQSWNFSRHYFIFQCHMIFQKSFVICWFAAQETFLIIINVENSCAAQFFFLLWWIEWEQHYLKHIFNASLLNKSINFFQKYMYILNCILNSAKTWVQTYWWIIFLGENIPTNICTVSDTNLSFFFAFILIFSLWARRWTVVVFTPLALKQSTSYRKLTFTLTIFPWILWMINDELLIIQILQQRMLDGKVRQQEKAELEIQAGSLPSIPEQSRHLADDRVQRPTCSASDRGHRDLCGGKALAVILFLSLLWNSLLQFPCQTFSTLRDLLYDLTDAQNWRLKKHVDYFHFELTKEAPSESFNNEEVHSKQRKDWGLKA